MVGGEVPGKEPRAEALGVLKGAEERVIGREERRWRGQGIW